MFPHGLHDAVFKDGQFVCVATLASRWGLGRRMEHPIDRGHLHLRSDGWLVIVMLLTVVVAVLWLLLLGGHGGCGDGSTTRSCQGTQDDINTIHSGHSHRALWQHLKIDI